MRQKAPLNGSSAPDTPHLAYHSSHRTEIWTLKSVTPGNHVYIDFDIEECHVLKPMGVTTAVHVDTTGVVTFLGFLPNPGV